jgi:hypothetical protein
MALGELDPRRAERIVGGLCRRGTQPEVADELRLIHEVEGRSIVIGEERPDRRDPGERVCAPVAELRCVRSSGLRAPHRVRADLKGHAHEPEPPALAGFEVATARS